MAYLINTAIASAMVVITAMTYASPVLLTVAWVRRLKGTQHDGVRQKAGWLSLMLGSVAFILFIVAIEVSPDPGSAEFEIWFAKWLKISSVASCVAFVASVVGAGRMQWAVRISAATPPLALLVAKILE
jgi:hypothetical protein